MANLTKKFFTIIFTALLPFVLCGCSNKFSKANSWIECGQDLIKASQIAGFSFPLPIKNAKIQAMKDMIEITYPLDKSKDAIIRKCDRKKLSLDEHGIAEISGDNTEYPVNEGIQIYESVWMNVRGDSEKIYVANFASESGNYSINCLKGLSLEEVKTIFDMITDVEAPKNLQ